MQRWNRLFSVCQKKAELLYSNKALIATSITSPSSCQISQVPILPTAQFLSLPLSRIKQDLGSWEQNLEKKLRWKVSSHVSSESKKEPHVLGDLTFWEGPAQGWESWGRGRDGLESMRWARKGEGQGLSVGGQWQAPEWQSAREQEGKGVLVRTALEFDLHVIWIPICSVLWMWLHFWMNPEGRVFQMIIQATDIY